jgi:hypothetical protein
MCREHISRWIALRTQNDAAGTRLHDPNETSAASAVCDAASFGGGCAGYACSNGTAIVDLRSNQVGTGSSRARRKSGLNSFD